MILTVVGDGGSLGQVEAIRSGESRNLSSGELNESRTKPARREVMGKVIRRQSAPSFTFAQETTTSAELLSSDSSVAMCMQQEK